MPDPLEEECQVVPDQYDISTFAPQSDDDQDDHHIPDTQSKVKEAQPIDGDDNSMERDSLDQGQDSFASRVGETQFVHMGPETQALGQDSLESRVSEAQFARIKIDPQAMETQASPGSGNLPFSPDTDHVLQSINTDKPVAPPTGNEAVSNSFFRRPDAHETSPDEGFSFAIAVKPKVGQFTLPPPKHGEGASKSNSPQDATPVHTAPKSQGQ
jgi:hypothetical protein